MLRRTGVTRILIAVALCAGAALTGRTSAGGAGGVTEYKNPRRLRLILRPLRGTLCRWFASVVQPLRFKLSRGRGHLAWLLPAEYYWGLCRAGRSDHESSATF